MDALRTGAAWREWWVWKVFFMFYSIFSVFSGAFACGVGFSPYLCSANKMNIVVFHTAGISVMMSIANSSAWTFFIIIRKVRHALGRGPRIYKGDCLNRKTII